MENQPIKLNKEVTDFLDALNHPFSKEIGQLRSYKKITNAARESISL